MKALNSIIALALMAVTIAPVLAESIDVKVIGTITPVACTPTLAGGGVVDYGNIATSTLSPTNYTLLDEKKLDFAITCDAPVKLALKATNGRPNTLAGAIEGASGFGVAPINGFFGGSTSGVAAAGLGLANEKKIGGYALRIDASSVTADSAQVDSVIRNSADASWAKSDTGIMLSATTERQNSWAATGTVAPVAFTTLAGKLSVQAYINKSSELDLAQPITLDGLTTLELVYL
jgi:type 1 fimbria pilin